MQSARLSRIASQYQSGRPTAMELVGHTLRPYISIPVYDNVIDFKQAVGDGRWGAAALYGGLAVLDGVTLGGDSLVEGLTKGGFRLAARELELRVAERVVPNSGLSLRHTGGGGYVDAADELYAGIRANGTDVNAIAQNTGIKSGNVQKVKDHVFYNEHLLDRYVDYGIDPVRARFDSDLNQAQAWHRLESGTHTKADITWLRHEAAERWYELRHNSGYTAAHNAAERKWPGNPWGEQ